MNDLEVLAAEITIRKRRKPKPAAINPIEQIAKAIIFAPIGLALGILFLWWVCGNDAFQLGPTVAKLYPEIVPVEFRK